MFKFLVFFISTLVLVEKSVSTNINTINRCSFPVWVGFFAPGIGLPNNGGWQLNPGQQYAFNIPSNLQSARLWGRTGCKYVNGQFRCETGDCGPKIQCEGRTGEPPATLAEWSLNGWGNKDYYDISLVDGYNVKMSMVPKNPSGSEGDPNYWCKSSYCTTDLNGMCPYELRKTNAFGQAVACTSPCTKYNTDLFCCRGAYGTPQACKSNKLAGFFKTNCPKAYSFAYDDNTSTFFCRNTDYDIIFC